MFEKHTLISMRLAVLCLLASGALPSPSRAQEAPVFKIMTEDSSVSSP
jgi:hypothetical protein